MAVRTKTQFKALYGTAGTLFPDNTTGEISEADVRSFGEDIADSFVDESTDTIPTLEDVLTADNDAHGLQIKNLFNGSDPQDAVNLDQLNAAALGIVTSWKAPVVNATTANITLSGEQTIDGVLTNVSRILVKNQSTQSENGIYITAAGAWARSSDANVAAELEGAAVTVEEGTANENTTWIQTSDNITLGSSNIVWAQLGTTVPDANETDKGISEEATVAELLAGTATGGTGAKLFITPAKFKAFRDITEATPVLATGTLTCDCASKQESAFYYATLSASANIVFSNKSNSQINNLIIAITGSGIVLTFESDVRMARYNESGSWNQSAKTLTVSSVGTGDLHEFSLKRAGSVFILRYDGPVRA